MTSYLSSLSRLREYAIMRALGATGKDISHIFLWQNAFLVLCGTAAGTLLGIGAYTLLAHALAVQRRPLLLPLFSFSPVMGILLAATVAATPSIKSYSFENPERKTGLHDVILNRKTPSNPCRKEFFYSYDTA